MIKSYKDVQRILKSSGYILIASKCHEKWSNGSNTVIIPHKHKSFHVVTHKTILKRAGLI